MQQVAANTNMGGKPVEGASYCAHVGIPRKEKEKKGGKGKSINVKKRGGGCCEAVRRNQESCLKCERITCVVVVE